MGTINRQDFSAGWFPSADAVNAPKNALLRMDNLTLDEQGAVSLRAGSAKVNSSALADLDVHSLYTVKIDNARRRFIGADDAVYVSDTATGTTIDGEGDIQFGAHQGQVLYTRGSTHKKHDGATERNWGIDAPDDAPTLAALTPYFRKLAVGGSVDSPAFTASEGTYASTTDFDSIANSAAQLTPDATTGRATMTLTYVGTDSTLSMQNPSNPFQTLPGTDDDLITFYAYVTEPQFMESITLMIDANDGTFEQDYYYYTFIPGETIEAILSNDEYLAGDYSAEGFTREQLLARLENRNPLDTTFRRDKPVNDTGWARFSVPRGKMRRVGSTSGKNWSTVKALRVTVQQVSGSTSTVRFTRFYIYGGSERRLTGRYKAIVVAVRNDGTYEALSGPSDASDELEVEVSGIRSTVASGTVSSLDSQVNELWLFLQGGRLNGYYRYAVKTGGPFSGAQTIDAIISDRDALIANIRLETDNTTPPDDIIGIEGPHYDRTLCLTATHLYPSRQRNPDSFASGQVLKIGDSTETGLWVKKDNETLYVGTTLDVYRIDGDWTALPDGTLNIAKRPLGVTAPPINSAVAVGHVNGADVLVYLSASGWHVLGGGSLTTAQVELLWRGQDRHGVEAVNIADTSARLRCAISKNVLYALTPEGGDTTSTHRIHAYHFGRQRWYRFTYTASWRSIYAEPDGRLVAGTTDGFVYTLDEPTRQDAGSDIPVVLWTPVDDNGEPFTAKDFENLSIRVNTGGNTATVGLHLDNSANPTTAETSADDDTSVSVADVSNSQQARLAQLRITGSFSTFILRHYSINYLDNPKPLVYHDTGFIDLSDAAIQWVRRLRIKARSPGTLTVTPYWDGTAGTARTVSVTADKRQIYTVPLGREDKGKTARVVVTSTDPSQVYWVEFEFNGSGKQNQKKRVKMGDAA